MSSPTEGRTLTYGEAVFEATQAEMRRDPKVFVMGQGVDDAAPSVIPNVQVGETVVIRSPATATVMSCWGA